jgi:hypothetical protein
MKKILYTLILFMFSIFIIQSASANGTSVIEGNFGPQVVLNTTPPATFGPTVGNHGANFNFPTVNDNNGNNGGTVRGGFGTYAIVDANGTVTNIVVCEVFCANGTFGPGGDTAVLQVPGETWGFWFGPNTTTYDKENKMFTATRPTVVESIDVDSEGNVSSVIIEGKENATFYSENLFFSNGINRGLSLDSTALVSVTNNGTEESLNLGNRKTEQEARQLIQDSNLLLLNSKVQTLISMLESWIK